MNSRKHVTLYEEYRLIERNEVDINRAWKGAHLLLFFLAFVFGSFCTFCFHMLMYLFDEKCVLFPKLLSLTSLRHNVIYEFIPSSRDLSSLPVDFVSTQWVEKSTCALPTYVPLVSGIFGLVWTTMFLMCSTGSRTLTGLQRPWRVLPPVFVFSFAMGALCVYSSAVTHYGLQELCVKLGEITGSSTCTYAVNVATLTYERRIRGVYQATRLTIVSAWLHTLCWLFSALLAAVRVVLGVDFQLVRISVKLRGDIDSIMEQNETQIRTIYPDNVWITNENEKEIRTILASKSNSSSSDEGVELLKRSDEILDKRARFSKLSLESDESYKLTKLQACKNVPKNKRFIVKMVYDLIESIPEGKIAERNFVTKDVGDDAMEQDRVYKVKRQIGKHELVPKNAIENWDRIESSTFNETEDVVHYARSLILDGAFALIRGREAGYSGEANSHVKKKLTIKSDAEVVEVAMRSHQIMPEGMRVESVMNITDEMRDILLRHVTRNISWQQDIAEGSEEQTGERNVDTQTEIEDRRKILRPRKREKKPMSIPENTEDEDESPGEDEDNIDKETQTPKKEKED